MSRQELPEFLGAESVMGQQHIIFDLRHQRLASRLDPDHFTTARILGKTNDLLVDANRTARDVSRSIAIFAADHPVTSAMVGFAVTSLIVGSATRGRQM